MRKLAIVLIPLLMLVSVIGSISCTSSGIAQVEDIYASRPHLDLAVALVPTDSAEAGKQYKVDLYGKGEFRGTSTISWSEAELNAKLKINKIKTVHFPLTNEEFWTYLQEDVSHIFSATVRE